MTRSKPTAALPFADGLATLDREPIVIPGSRGKAVMLLVACVGFVMLGLVAIVKGEDDVLSMGLPAALIFGLGGSIAILQIVRPPVMTLTMDGVSVQTIFKTWSVRWDQVEEFFVYKARNVNQAAGYAMGTTEMAAFNWTAPVAAGKHGLLSGKKAADGGFGPGWTVSAADLVSLLNAAKTRALGREMAG